MNVRDILVARECPGDVGKELVNVPPQFLSDWSADCFAGSAAIMYCVIIAEEQGSKVCAHRKSELKAEFNDVRGRLSAMARAIPALPYTSRLLDRCADPYRVLRPTTRPHFT
jgi:hypothetical protein